MRPQQILDDIALYLRVQPIMASTCIVTTALSVGWVAAGMTNLVTERPESLFPAFFCSMGLYGAINNTRVAYDAVVEKIKTVGLGVTLRNANDRKYAKIHAERTGCLDDYVQALDANAYWKEYKSDR